ncbi:high mobility group B protein 3 [Cornus florida]|uniref:high mobility group B protein 3 n=1 Tax=Cornus florida TaxID=4283 RepID=UPI0028A0E6F7|nr:high mobility group B protein 3 [Cornus florida]
MCICSHCCGVVVAIALADMHECESEKGAKRIKGESGNQNYTDQRFQDQPRSPFLFFMESFVKTCVDGNLIDVDRKGVETWRKMSKKERLPYVLQAQKVNSDYENALLKEVEDMSWVDDEADSAEVGKHDKGYNDYQYYDDSDGYEGFWSESCESLNTYEWEMLRPWITAKSR